MPKREGQVGHRERPAWETQIAKLDGKVELVVNPAMLADKMKIIRAQSVHRIHSLMSLGGAINASRWAGDNNWRRGR